MGLKSKGNKYCGFPNLGFHCLVGNGKVNFLNEL